MADNEVGPLTDFVQPAKPKTRDELRAAFFDPKYTRIEPVHLKWNGIDLDWYRPSIDQVQKAQDASSTEGQNFMVMMLINYSYIEGTKEKFFEPADYEMLVALPLTGEFNDNVRKVSEALNLRVEEKVKN